MNDEQVTISPELIQKLRDSLLANILAHVLEHNATNPDRIPLSKLNADLRPSNSRVNLDVMQLIHEGALTIFAGDVVDITPHGVNKFERIVGIQKLVEGVIEVRAHNAQDLLKLYGTVARMWSDHYTVISSELDQATRTVKLHYTSWLPATTAALYQ